MQTITGGTIAPNGTQFYYTQFKQLNCDHGRICFQCDYIETKVPVTLDNDILAIVVDQDDNSVLDWITADSPAEFAINLVHSGELVISESTWKMEDVPKPIVAAMHEATLYANCFG